MSHEERNAVAAIASQLLIAGFFAWRLSAMAAEGRLDGPDALAVWARAVLWMVPAGIALLIALNVLVAIVTLDGSPSFVVDERDRAIEVRGLNVTLIVGTGGFLGGVGLLALGFGAVTALNVMLAGFAAGNVMGDGARLWLYRRGL